MRNSQGQLAIFVVLVFQVLFVLFAMAINVALIVHDKINLQNAVDLAAYYAAAKQAEMLNAMAHQNYQIRQSYKLLAWRYRVLGTTGLLQSGGVKAVQYYHPSNPGINNFNINETEWFGAAVSDPNRLPVVCINYVPTWQSPPAPPKENVCKDRRLQVQTIPVIQNQLATFNPLNAVISSFSRNLARNFDSSCQNVGVWNWWFMKAIKESYRQDMANRRRVIEAMARAASRPVENWQDIDGNNIASGAQQTFYKNLTWSNSTTSQEDIQFQVYNSLSKYETSEETYPQWLQPIMIWPFFQYTDLRNGCNALTKWYQDPPNNTGVPDYGYIMSSLHGDVLMSRPPYPIPDFYPERLIVGYEKNPWMMAYVAVQASVKSRQIFHPFGPAVTLTAKAYAKPFGGRMGPWYGREWAPGDPKSSGPKVDTRGQPRTEAGGLLASQADTDRFPNYSRFPGDELGLSSRLAQASLKHLNVNFQGNVRHYFDSYLVIRPGNTNDPLAWDTKTQTPPASRTFEIAAIIPDLFDIAYYSIDANYWGNYGAKINANKGALGIADDVVIRPDLGYHAGIPDLENYNVRRQIEVARASGLQIPEAFYYVKSFQHLLTGWVPGPLANNYTTAADPKVPFGKCEQADFSSDPNNPAPPNPGACIVGGRTGYSVKLVSGNYLKSNNFLIGSGNTKGPILNPPPF